ncbi:MAG TPA: diacylglycerol kinase family protein [Pirellulaceae bacterium]|jgi:diacylglycerol kinase (ATP)|nr:diacylglycerol kinase family protein [Pirellulaceae bacterium]
MEFVGKRAVVIWNPGAGTIEAAAEARDFLDRHPDVLVVQTESLEHAEETVQKACSAKVERIVAAGGDGSINAVVNALFRYGGDALPAFGVLPFGSGNDFARTLGMFDDEDAVATILDGPIRPGDAIFAEWEGGDRLVANMATGGNTGQFLERLDDKTKKAWGPLVYVRGVIDVLRDLRAFPATVTFDDESMEVDMFNFFVANGKTSGGGMVVAPHESLFDGYMTATVVRSGAAGEIVGLTADYLMQAFLDNDLIEQRTVERFTVRGKGPLPVTIDGDLVTDGPIEFRVLPGALPLIVPPSLVEDEVDGS